jgi:hypothetical protein
VTETAAKVVPKVATQSAPKPSTQAAAKPATEAAPRPTTQPAPRAPTGAAPAQPATAAPKQPGSAPSKPPPGMTEADVNVLYQKYVQAKQLVGETVGPDGRNKLLKTIHAQAPKIMQQYQAKGVDFSVVVKDNQVILRAKPKT